MRTQAIVFDLDDTLLRDDRTISEYTIRTLRMAREQGIHVIPASGRAMESMRSFVDQIGCASCYISCNGAEIWGWDHSLVKRHLIPHDTLMDIVRLGRERNLYTQHYDGAFFYYSQESEWARMYAKASMLTGVYAGDLEVFLQDKQSAKVLMMSDPAIIASLLTECTQRYAGKVSVTCSKPYFLEFNPLAATKGKALLDCADLLGFDVAASVAFGDSLNDLSMLQTAGLGVAMGNARADVAALIPTHCKTNMEDGVARFIEDHLFHKEVQA